MHSVSRRTFLKLSCGTIALTVTPASAMFPTAQVDFTAQPQTGGEAWSGSPGHAKFRIDGLPKVLGEKIYTRDFYARDLPGWPEQERVAMVLRATCVDRTYEGYDLDLLGRDLKPLKIVDQAQLDSDDVNPLWYNSAPKNWPSKIMVSQGDYAGYYGQPIAILIFKNMRIYRQAYRRLQFNPDVINYGEKIQRQAATPYQPTTFLTRYKNQFSQAEDGSTTPYSKNPNSADLQARKFRELIELEVVAETEAQRWQTLNGKRSTQLIVPMFMEPEAGLGWYDTSGLKMNLLLGTQSPDGDVSDGASLLGSQRIAEVDLISCYPGGGFGGRDSSPFTTMLILAAYYSDLPVRLAYDRFTEFQAGLTQLQANIDQHLSVDASGKFQAIKTIMQMPAGGRNNFSQYVAELAAYCAAGAYDIPRACVDAVAQPTPGLIAGSMRGFGGPQAAFALETLVDEVASQLKMDSIALRQLNLLKEGDQIVTGAPVSQPLRFDEICQRARSNPLWENRELTRKNYRLEGKLYGVGFALANQAYGTGKDGVMADVALSESGKIMVRTNAVDMGNGSATTLAMAPAAMLGKNADEIEMGQVNIFDVLDLSTTPTKTGRGRGGSTDSWSNPYYTAAFSMSSSACITAFQQFHAVTQASQVLFDTSIWPSAIALWERDPGLEAKASVVWDGEQLSLTGFATLSLSQIAREIYNHGGIVAAMVHACFEGDWVHAQFHVEDNFFSWAIDGLNTRSARQDSYVRYQRDHVKRPPKNAANYGRNLFSPSGSLIAVTVDPGTGQVGIEAVHSYLNAGKIHQPDLVSGQYQGGVAMGVGYALLENLPPGADGGGSGEWNLNRYHVPLAGDLPLDRITLEILEPLDANEPARGIAEAVLCPIAPAIANAVAAATGKHFNQLPITSARVLEALS